MEINLCSISDFSFGSEDKVDFVTSVSQEYYFRKRTIYSIDAPLKADANLYYIPVNKSLMELERINYCYYAGLDQKYYYYYVMDREYKTENVTYLYIKLDVFQTYMFNYTLLQSFVDRCHVNRWTKEGYPTKEYEPEEINYGENILKYLDNVAHLGTGIVYATTTPIGKLRTLPSGGEDGGDGDGCGDWENGVLSNDCFRMLKGYEGFGIYEYRDSGGVLTIGYGVTKSEPDIYNKLKALEPVPEEIGAKEAYKLKIERYGKPIVQKVKSLGCTTQQQFDALLDLAYNAGTGVIGANNSLMNAIRKNPNDESYIRPIWENFYIRDDHGVPQEGLRARRKAEADIYFKGIYEKRPILTIKSNGSYGPAITENNGNGWMPECQAKPVPNGKYVDNKAGKNWLIPVHGELSGLYPSYPSGKLHNGLDIACDVGTDVRASKDGVVIDKQMLETSYGYHLKIQHGDSVVIYAHNSELLVNKGDKVKQGQIIAKSGATGNVTGPHVHWEIRNDNVGEVIQHGVKTVNPYPAGKLNEKV